MLQEEGERCCRRTSGARSRERIDRQVPSHAGEIDTRASGRARATPLGGWALRISISACCSIMDAFKKNSGRRIEIERI